MPIIAPSAKEIKEAASKKNTDAIPFRDLRDEAKREYQKQLTVCKDQVGTNTLTTSKEFEAARIRIQKCREQRIKVRTVFARAIGRAKSVLTQMKPGEPLKPDMARIVRELESTKVDHEKAITQLNEQFTKCEAHIKHLIRAGK